MTMQPAQRHRLPQHRTTASLFIALALALLVLSLGACDSLAPEAELSEVSGTELYADTLAALAKRGGKVVICHRRGRKGYKKLSVGASAAEGHLGHGDGFPGEAVPGQEGFVFDEKCDVVPAPTGEFRITGSVYTESDKDTEPGYGTREDNELGIENVTVALHTTAGSTLQETQTDSEGAFAFESLAAGEYHVVIPQSTPADDPNELLYTSSPDLYVFSGDELAPDGTARRTVTVGPDAGDVDLGFEPKAEAIVEALEQGVITTQNPLPFTDWATLIAGLGEYVPEVGGAFAKTNSEVYFSREVAGYRVDFLGREIIQNEATTYYYQIEGAGVADQVSFELDPACTLLGSSPEGSVPGTQDRIEFGLPAEGAQVYSLTFGANVDPGVIDVAFGDGEEAESVKMPGACVDAVATTEDLLGALDLIFFSGPGDEFIFLPNPLELVEEDEVSGAIRILSQEDLVEFSLPYLEQRLLIAELIFLLGFGTEASTFDETIFEFSEPVIQILSERVPSKRSSGMTIQGGTGGTEETGRMLNNYIRRR